MRLFVGLDIPADVKDSLARLIERLRPTAKLRWSPVQNLHITTKFIGEWPEVRLREMESALGFIRGHQALPVAIRGLGWFPNPHNPRIFWAAVRAERLGALAMATEEATQTVGVAPEKRPYSPHLTLARIEGAPDLALLRRAVASLDSDEFGEFTATQFHLYLSQPGAGGSVYTKLASFPLPSS